MIELAAGTDTPQDAFAFDCGSRRIWSLWDMLEFEGTTFLAVTNSIQHSITYLNQMGEDNKANILDNSVNEYPDSLESYRDRHRTLERLLPLLGARLTLMAVKRLADGLEDGVTFKEMASAYEDISSRLHDELSLTYLFVVESDKVKFLTTDSQIFGKEIEDKFPQMSEDITEAAKCLALSRPTAAVFHLMRVMEIAVQRFGEKLGINLVNELNWQVILDQINKSIKLLNHKLSETKMMAEAAAHLYTVKTAWRNEVMHPKQTYREEEAESIFNNCRIFLREVAKIL